MKPRAEPCPFKPGDKMEWDAALPAHTMVVQGEPAPKYDSEHGLWMVWVVEDGRKFCVWARDIRLACPFEVGQWVV
ncbi:MAG: hypothetical protein IMZ71_02015, partial [Chloroflexi bacterium]|nr:hypothetical protein [Chloroflexota bacterium]